MVLNAGPLDWESSALTTRPLLLTNINFMKFVVRFATLLQPHVLAINSFGGSGWACRRCFVDSGVPKSTTILGLTLIYSSNIHGILSVIFCYLC